MQEYNAWNTVNNIRIIVV